MAAVAATCRYCDKPARYSGLCAGHESRYRFGKRGDELTAPIRTYEPTDLGLTPDDQIKYLRNANKALRDEITQLHGALASRQEQTEAIKAAVVSNQPLPRVYWKIPKSKGGPTSAVSLVILFSDLHVGEQIKADETEGFGEYSWAIAQRRAHSMITSILGWVETLRHGYRINECAIFGLGDYISGDIHDELRVTNEFPLPVQTANAGILIGDLITRLAAHFDKVIFYQVGATITDA